MGYEREYSLEDYAVIGSWGKSIVVKVDITKTVL